MTEQLHFSYPRDVNSYMSILKDVYMGLVHWDDPERWYEEGDGRGVQDWEHMYTHFGFMLMYGKTNTVL